MITLILSAILINMAYIFFATGVVGLVFRLTTNDILNPKWWSFPLYLATMIPAVLSSAAGLIFLNIFIFNI